MYPSDWPRCPVCDDFALDGHITCGRLQCNEQEQRYFPRGRPSETKEDDEPPYGDG